MVSTIVLSIPTPDDFAAISKLKADAFADKQVTSDGGREYHETVKQCPEKIQHGRIARIDGAVAGAIQLQMHNDIGDLSFPAGLRHVLTQGEAYVEFIATHSKFRGKGVGSRLLAWADEFARAQGCRKLTLEVFKANEGAVRLYERKGFQIVEGERECFGSLLFCLLSCGKYWTILFMVKDLAEEGSNKPEEE